MARRQRIDSEVARYALSGIQAEIARLQAQAKELVRAIGAGKVAVPSTGGYATARRKRGPVRPRKRRLSAEARGRMSAAQKARWARQRAEKF
jgi:hypothetical protein